MAKNDVPTKDDVQETKSVTHSTNSSNTGQYLLLVIAGIAVLAVVFGAGMAVQRHQRINKVGVGSFVGMHEYAGGRRFGGGFAMNQNGTVLSGKISSVSGADFIIDQNGSSKTIKTDSNTRFRGVGISGLQNGNQVTVAGTANSDGSVQALSVSITSTM